MSELHQNNQEDAPEAVSAPRKFRVKHLSKRAFWIWIGYQAVKGTLTTTFIWGPLIYAYFFHH